ncbi:MAG TPA: tetratricopeptide repeat protein [Gemmataceae bacterium]|nr:tetratricopeptide repeat protein [Gemmataceae bacterium]
MDSRGALRLGVCLLIAAAGCQQQVLNVPNPGSISSTGNPAQTIDPSQIKKASDKPKKLPPLVYVTYGNFEAGEAFAARTEADRRQPLCDSARADYEKALKIDPKCVPAYQGLARLYKAMHELPLAVETYQKALKVEPKNAALWYELGLCHNSQKNVGPALECLDRAAQIDPANRSYANALGVVLAESGRYEDSLKCFVRSSGEALGYYRLAQTLRHLQQPELSQRYMEVAVQKDPSLAETQMVRSDRPDSANSPAPQIQQTAYRPAACPAPIVPPVEFAPAAVNPPSPPQVILPPPPPINGE